MKCKKDLKIIFFLKRSLSDKMIFVKKKKINLKNIQNDLGKNKKNICSIKPLKMK